MRADVKTDASHRTLTLPTFLIEMLAEHLACEARTGSAELVFQADDGGPVRYTNFRQRVFNVAIREAGLDSMTFHSPPRSAGGFLRQAGAHTHVIQQRLEHASSRTTTDIDG